ncbi:MAG: hypothetical protein LBG58_06090 [Planctomycetaceae bacterium]|nr:hypothetical protein [Planctomycetaceae bacterium]
MFQNFIKNFVQSKPESHPFRLAGRRLRMEYWENATEYVVSRRTVNNPSWLELTTTSGTGFFDTTVPLGDFEYRVTASNSSNSTDSNIETVNVTLCSPVPAVDASNPDEAVVTWNAVNNADYYSVWIKVGTAAWTRLANNVTGTSFTDASPLNGETVKYAVKAHHGTLVSTMTLTRIFHALFDTIFIYFFVTCLFLRSYGEKHAKTWIFGRKQCVFSIFLTIIWSY